jgi:diguanylate cyclase (GGDEF)-like protein
LFGTLCAVHPAPQPEQILAESGTVELLARLLSTYVCIELRDVARARRERRAVAHEEGHEDPSTGLLDRRAWGEMLAAEQRVCERLGSIACILQVHVNQAKAITAWGGPPQTEEVLRRATKILANATRPSDATARVGRYDLAILMCECEPVDLGALVVRLQSAFDESRLDVSIGTAHWKTREPLTETWRRAEEKAIGRDDVKPAE